MVAFLAAGLTAAFFCTRARGMRFVRAKACLAHVPVILDKLEVGLLPFRPRLEKYHLREEFSVDSVWTRFLVLHRP